ncbi:hypothetical protein [Terriglobus sp.]|uniref:hypothetical protein n=1 Tax=Terriglobus sp. TaxID=1889013 RepID=UPI003B0001B9
MKLQILNRLCAAFAMSSALTQQVPSVQVPVATVVAGQVLSVTSNLPEPFTTTYDFSNLAVYTRVGTTSPEHASFHCQGQIQGTVKELVLSCQTANDLVAGEYRVSTPVKVSKYMIGPRRTTQAYGSTPSCPSCPSSSA